MSNFSMAPILMHSTDLSESVRTALREAYATGPAERPERLRSVAHLMFEELGDLDCADVKELVGL
jgi:hypothetical protein